jgi:hypothetical protein
MRAVIGDAGDVAGVGKLVLANDLGCCGFHAVLHGVPPPLI